MSPPNLLIGFQSTPSQPTDWFSIYTHQKVTLHVLFTAEMWLPSPESGKTVHSLIISCSTQQIKMGHSWSSSAFISSYLAQHFLHPSVGVRFVMNLVHLSATHTKKNLLSTTNSNNAGLNTKKVCDKQLKNQATLSSKLLLNILPSPTLKKTC